MNDKEKMLAWLDYAIRVNQTEFDDSGGEYWSGRMVAYRNVRDRLKANDWGFLDD